MTLIISLWSRACCGSATGETNHGRHGLLTLSGHRVEHSVCVPDREEIWQAVAAPMDWDEIKPTEFWRLHSPFTQHSKMFGKEIPQWMRSWIIALCFQQHPSRVNSQSVSACHWGDGDTGPWNAPGHPIHDGTGVDDTGCYYHYLPCVKHGPICLLSHSLCYLLQYRTVL